MFLRWGDGQSGPLMSSQGSSQEGIPEALAGIAQWIECGLRTKGLLVRFPVRAHAWVAGQAPSGGNHTLMFLSLPPLPLS